MCLLDSSMSEEESWAPMKPSHRGAAHRAGVVASYRAEAKKAAAAARAADLASLIRDIRTLAPPVSAPSPANWTPANFCHLGHRRAGEVNGGMWTYRIDAAVLGNLLSLPTTRRA